MNIFHRSTQAPPQGMRGVFVNARMHASQIPLALASVALSTGRYSITSSGDGNALVSTTGSVYTSNSLASNLSNAQEYAAPNSPKIARSIFNDLAHLTLTHTPSGGALTFQNVAGGLTNVAARIKWSPGGFNGATATATAVPTATNGTSDEAILWGGNTDASPQGTLIDCDPLNGRYRVTIGVSDDATYPFLYVLVWAGILAGSAATFCLVWDSVIRSPGQALLDPDTQVCGCWSPPSFAIVSPGAFTGVPNEGIWGRFGAAATVRQFRLSSPYALDAGQSLYGKIGRSAAGRSPRDTTTVERQYSDTTNVGVKGRLRNVELCLRNVGQLQPFDDADNDVRSALYRVGDILLPFNRFGANGAAGRLLRP